jgi:hypothetical protein
MRETLESSEIRLIQCTLIDKVKLFSYRWLRVTDVTFASSLHCWWSSSLLCLALTRCCFTSFLCDLHCKLCSPSGTSCAEGATCSSSSLSLYISFLPFIKNDFENLIKSYIMVSRRNISSKK